MTTRKRASELQGEAHSVALDEVRQELRDRLAAAAEGRDDLRAGLPVKSTARYILFVIINNGREKLSD